MFGRAYGSSYYASGWLAPGGSGGGGGGIALDQTLAQQSGSGLGASVNASFTTAPAAGALVVVMIAGWHASGFDLAASNPVTDNQGNSYTVVKSALAGGARAAIAYAPNVTSSGTFTITLNFAQTTGNSLEWGATSWTGIATTNPADLQGTNSQTNTTNPTATATGTAAKADELNAAVTAGDDPATNVGYNTPTGYTQRYVQQNASGTVGMHAADQIVASTQTNPTVSWGTTTATIDGAASVLVTFKSASGGNTFSYTGSGGIVFSGGGDKSKVKAFLPTGGLQFNGSAGLIKIKDFLATGGIQFGGSAAWAKIKDFLASGLLQFGGAGVTSFQPGGNSFSYVGSGGILFAGQALLNIVKDVVGSGGLQFGGSSLNSKVRVYSPSGGMQFSGNAAWSKTKAYLADGGINFSGSAGWTFTKVYVASGGLIFAGAAQTQGPIVLLSGTPYIVLLRRRRR